MNDDGGDPCISIKNVSVAYHTEVVLDDISLDIEHKDFLAIIGPNGGGKTTLVKVLIGMLEPIAGTVSVLGTSPKRSRTKIGYVPQTAHYATGFPITAYEVVLMGRSGRRGLFHRFTKEDVKAAHEALGRVGMLAHRDRPFDHLSGGQRQRVIIARALANEPELLLLDEPNVGVDPAAKSELYTLLHELNESMTIVLVTHDLTAVSSHVKTIACINKRLYSHGGKEIPRETIAEMYHCPVELIAHGVPHRVLEEH
ncbi:MAG: metal ABC transporter ATP-binding protein [Candidatus Methanofastidiosa archaeon]|nr:metal ABC transporter ATP-binding protein [Candidatus Methanofastidiosa archaeon]